MCNVVEMEDSYVLSGQPWYQDFYVIYIGRDNRYVLWLYDKKIVLVSCDEQLASCEYLHKEQKIYKVDDDVKMKSLKMMRLLPTMILQGR